MITHGLCHTHQKHYYDLRRRQVSYNIVDLVRVRTQPRSDAQVNFNTKLAPLYMLVHIASPKNSLPLITVLLMLAQGWTLVFSML